MLYSGALPRKQNLDHNQRLPARMATADGRLAGLGLLINEEREKPNVPRIRAGPWSRFAETNRTLGGSILDSVSVNYRLSCCSRALSHRLLDDRQRPSAELGSVDRYPTSHYSGNYEFTRSPKYESSLIPLSGDLDHNPAILKATHRASGT